MPKEYIIAEQITLISRRGLMMRLKSSHQNILTNRGLDYIGGIGVVRVTLDLSTGNVSKAAMVRSTGVPAIDNSAMEGFRQWQWKPGKWKEIDVPIIFTKPGVVVTPDGAGVIVYDGRR